MNILKLPIVFVMDKTLKTIFITSRFGFSPFYSRPLLEKRKMMETKENRMKIYEHKYKLPMIS